MIRALLILFSFLFLNSCVQFREIAIFDLPQQRQEPENIDGFYSLNILEDKVTDELWFTNNKKCLNIENSLEIKYSGEGSIHMVWDKQAGGCPWLGMGIGWDGWTPKDISRIMNKAAIQMKVFSKDKIIKTLPLAASLEDYSSAQAWLGFSSNNIKQYEADSGWSTVILPLSDFGWDEFDADPTNLKQIIIQFEASGDIFLDEMKVIPFEGNLKNKALFKKYDNADIKVDGIANEQEWLEADTIIFEGHQFKICSDTTNLYIFGEVTDKDPLINKQKDDDIWNGDAIEIAFSTSTDADIKRRLYLLSDQQVGIKASPETQIWDWRKHRDVAGAIAKTVLSQKGYNIEISLPLKSFGIKEFEEGIYYGLEIAVDDGGTTGSRKTQQAWNSGGAGGFNTNPSMWGQIKFIK
jgi:hypothetical protein